MAASVAACSQERPARASVPNSHAGTEPGVGVRQDPLHERVAHGAAKRDREWAIEQLVALSLGGKAIDGVDVATKGFV